MCGDLQEEGLSGLEVAESLKEELLAREDSGAGEWQPAVARKMKVVLFRSGQAAYLGLGPYRLEKGGEIVVSREHRVAVLLRKAEGEEKRHRILLLRRRSQGWLGRNEAASIDLLRKRIHNVGTADIDTKPK